MLESYNRQIHTAAQVHKPKKHPSEIVTQIDRASTQLKVNHIQKQDAIQVKVKDFQSTLLHLLEYVNWAAGSQFRTA